MPNLDLDALARLAEAANSDPLGSTVLADFITVFGPDVVCALITAIRTQEALVRELVEAVELAQLWLANSTPNTALAGPKPLPVLAAALAKVKP